MSWSDYQLRVTVKMYWQLLMLPKLKDTVHRNDGSGGGKMAEVCDICMAVPCPVTARAQEIHILIGHILCELVDGE